MKEKQIVWVVYQASVHDIAIIGVYEHQIIAKEVAYRHKNSYVDSVVLNAK